MAVITPSKHKQTSLYFARLFPYSRIFEAKELLKIDLRELHYHEDNRGQISTVLWNRLTWYLLETLLPLLRSRRGKILLFENCETQGTFYENTPSFSSSLSSFDRNNTIN
jgi:hypothetical protein